MSSEALQRISVLIKDDVSPERVRSVKEQLIKQKSTIDYQLDKESSTFYGNVEKSLTSLNLSQQSVKNIRERLEEVNSLSDKNKSAISRYDVIFTSTRLYETIEMTSSIYDNIIAFQKLLQGIDDMLKAEVLEDPLDSGCPDLLHIHYSLSRARDFEDQILVMAAVSTDDIQRTARRLFSQVSEHVAQFDKLLESLIYDLVEIVRSEQISLAIRFFKIIALEEQEDLRIEAIRNIVKKKEIESEKSTVKKLPNNKLLANLQSREEEILDYPTSRGLYEEILSGTITTRTKPRGYKNFFLNKLKQSVRDMFVEVRKEYQGEKRFEVLNSLDWVFNEVLVVKDHVTKYCPKYWNIFDEYFNIYYEELHILITELVESEPETSIILDILDFDRNFQKVLVDDFGFSKKVKKSVIGDEQRTQLFDDYLSLIVVKMAEWIGNLEKAEFEVFRERKTPPHTDSEGLLYLDGTRTCFQMFTQQVEVAADSSQAKILVGVIDKFCGLLKERQKKWMKMVGDDVDKLLIYNEKYDNDPESISPEEECSGGLVEYVVAIANDQMKGADYSVAISTKYGKLVTKGYERSITQHIDETLDGFAEVARFCSNELIKIMFADLANTFTEIFSKSWYSGSHAKQISDTLYEYLIDIKSQMNVLVFASLLEGVVEETILRFISALKYEHNFKSKHNKFLDCMKRDFEIFYRVFVQLVPETEDKTLIIDNKFKLMEYFMDFSCGPPETILATWENCLSVYWDTPIELLSAILSCRKDIDNSFAKKTIANATEMSNDPARLQNLRENELQPTFIAKFTQMM
ncbi:hypothetical protein HG535_0E03420 [Zygotorulaspora mrakii]|uniref:Uncharacterized protein n=1 Tax=Zygotorulaspora mrakii TaxID=42260 RepID=A0A7H9B3L8_ZYGMR|nr:uncharacterized protein HG535_0E03420 [Zygotorulaspora mrakii]QLG73258.1 hypothetical protein HG535_0E03420 [Zygotorulaspora mrakii]